MKRDTMKRTLIPRLTPIAVLLALLPSSARADTLPSGKLWIWINPEQISRLPASGQAWDQMVSDANKDLMTIDIGNQNDKTDSYMMAAGLVYLKLREAGDSAANEYRARVQRACLTAIGTEGNATDALAACRQVCAVVVAANLIDWSDSSEEARFRSWVDDIRFRVFPDGRSITSTHRDRPNNWGTHAGASRLACALYLRDEETARDCVAVFSGWLGNRESYAGFEYGDLSWQDDEDRPVGINPLGAVKNGFDIGGVLPDDQRRSGPFPGDWSAKTNYVYEALQGVLAQAVMIQQEYPNVWNWSDQAILRAYEWLEDVHDQPITDTVNGSDDGWQAHLVNHVYGTDFLAPSSTNPGKAVGYTDWTTLTSEWPWSSE